MTANETPQTADRLQPGDAAPAFTLTSDKEEQVALSDFAGRKVLVFFYPRANTPGCTTESCDFRDNLARFNDIGIDVVGISPDKPAALQKFRDDHGLTFTLLSDPDKETMAAWGAFGEKKNYGKIVQGVIRSTVLVDADGTVANSWYNVRAKGHVDRVLRDLDD
ncbi:thioredoxin-dependent thiol peroxidase [Corynebacterium sp. TAE3-ERU12]|uniref:thioredoxin-dependent thiol peroxidase n=1 Tax=Corynebacterium sp. TAE3-ERU12 TaxID=2849491 RepID=UPI001C46516C|nr:thioredoxin-dependent thiol peroxidase [Corynebacterium sp. TAE3-ERU12]MBV7294886.1 thioredoxin-dependent thiol peroxidase [Corynebacterium sp. TAE3-ERU12]